MFKFLILNLIQVARLHFQELVHRDVGTEGGGGAQLPGRSGFYGLPRGSLRGRIADYGPRECDFYENILPRLRLLLTLHSEYKAYSKGCLGSCPG